MVTAGKTAAGGARQGSHQLFCCWQGAQRVTIHLLQPAVTTRFGKSRNTFVFLRASAGMIWGYTGVCP